MIPGRCGGGVGYFTDKNTTPTKVVLSCFKLFWVVLGCWLGCGNYSNYMANTYPLNCIKNMSDKMRIMLFLNSNNLTILSGELRSISMRRSCLHVFLYVCMYVSFFYNSAQTLHKLCTKSAQNLHKLCTNPAQNLHKIYTKSVQNLHKNFTKSAQTLHRLCTNSHEVVFQ
jgi:hypothetical protein